MKDVPSEKMLTRILEAQSRLAKLQSEEAEMKSQLKALKESIADAETVLNQEFADARNGQQTLD